MELKKLDHLHPATTSDLQSYRDLLAHVDHVYAFINANESALIDLDRRTAHLHNLRAAVRRAQRVLRPIAGDQSAILSDLSALGLTECPGLVGL
ncbi:MAG: hypothetical protein ACRDLM_05960 [Gaiellaceae bacterium]